MARKKHKKARRKRQREKKKKKGKNQKAEGRKGKRKTGNGKFRWAWTSKGRIMAIMTVLITIILLLSYFGYKSFQGAQEDKWTVMVYMAGDNSLNPQVQQNLNAMMEVGSGDNLDIVVLADSSGTKDSHLYLVKKGKLIDKDLNSINFQAPGEVDTGNPRTMSDFGKWAIEHHPADRYMLVMWGHGSGWKGLATDKGGSMLTLSEFNDSLKDIVNANDGKKLDIIGFDACIMATMEGYFQISPFADYLVASQKKEPDAGWPYTPILKEIKKGKNTSPDRVVKAIVEHYVNAYESGSLPDQDFSVGMVGVRTSEGSQFSMAFQRFASSLAGLSDSEKNILYEARKDLPIFEDKDNVDFLSFVNIAKELLSTNPLVRSSAEELLFIAGKVIVSEKSWDNPDSKVRMKGATGLCIYFPQGTPDPNYDSILMSRVTAWDEFIVGR